MCCPSLDAIKRGKYKQKIRTYVERYVLEPSVLTQHLYEDRLKESMGLVSWGVLDPY